MLTFLYISFFIVALTFAYAAIKGAPWVPTVGKDLERFLALAKIQPGQRMYDLGCGDGRLVVAAAEAGAEARGVELSLFPFAMAVFRQLLSPSRARVKILFRDIWHTDLSDADIVYFFLMPKVYPKLKEKLEKELKKGAKVITYVWAMPGWQAEKVDEAEGRAKMYLYQR